MPHFVSLLEPSWDY